MNLRLVYRHFLVWLPLCLSLLTASGRAAPPDSAGISFYVLRVIYAEDEGKGATLTAYNTTDATYLMQSRIRPVDPATGDVDLTDTKQMPLIVTPPLSRLESKGELALRIRRNEQPLPTDRESVFFVSMKAIPSQPQTAASGEKHHEIAASKVVLTVTSNIKVFYRPKGLDKRAVADVAPQLKFRREGNTLIAENPTPYWLTFSRLRVGETALEKAQLRMMVPPKGQQQYTLPAGANGTVVWQLIDEDGWDTPIEKQTL